MLSCLLHHPGDRARSRRRGERREETQPQHLLSSIVETRPPVRGCEVFWPGAAPQTPSSLDRWECLSTPNIARASLSVSPSPSGALGVWSPGSAPHAASFTTLAQGSAWSFPGPARRHGHPSPLQSAPPTGLGTWAMAPVCLRELPSLLSHHWVLQPQPWAFSAAVSKEQSEPFPPPPPPRESLLQHAYPSTS